MISETQVCSWLDADETLIHIYDVYLGSGNWGCRCSAESNSW